MYFVHNSGGSTTCESPSNTAIRFVAMMIFHLFRTAPLSPRQFSRSQPFRARVALPAHRGLRLERLLDLFLGWPPVGPLDLGHAVANKLLVRLDGIHAARVVSEKLRLGRLRLLTVPHRVRKPAVCGNVVDIEGRRPLQTTVERTRKTRRAPLIAHTR